METSFENEFGLDVQKKFLSVMIYDPSWTAINGLEVVKPDYFENNYLHNICKWIHDYHKQYKTVPTKLVLSEKVKDLYNNNKIQTREYYRYIEILDEIYQISGSDDYEFFKEKVVTFAREMAWKHALNDATGILKSGNYEEALEKFKEVLSIGLEKDLGLDFSKLTADELIKLASESYDTSNMVRTGIAGWDKALGGGFVRDNIHIIAASPGGGKSRTMAFLTKNALMAMKRVIFITLELSEVETMTNIYTSISGYTMYDMLKPENREDFKRKVSMFKNTFSQNLLVKFFRPGCVNTDSIHNYIRKVIQEKQEENGIEWKPDIIFVDYMDKLLPIQRIKGSSYEDMGAVANDLKNLAISFRCPVISGSQLGRYSWNVTGNDVVSMDSIAESAAKVHLAHSMTTINSNPEEKALGRARFFLAKSRSGNVNSVVWVENNLAKCNITEIDAWDPITLTGGAQYSIKSSSGNKK